MLNLILNFLKFDFLKAAWACSSCSGAITPEASQSYIKITVLLMVLPLTLISGFIYLYIRTKKLEKLENGESQHGEL